MVAARRRGVRAAAAEENGPLPTGGRVSLDKNEQWLAGALGVIVPPRNPNSEWAKYKLDEESFERIPAAKLVELLADISPETSRATWDWLRMLNPGWTVTVKAAGAQRSGDDTANAAGQAALDDFLDVLKRLYGSVDVPINRLHLGGYWRGAYCAELVLNDGANEMIDLATPDPASISFKLIRDEVNPARGAVWVPGQYQSAGQGNDGWMRLDIPTFRYVPIDPAPASPYGRSPALAAVFAATFLLSMMRDLRRVIQQQGYPRLDIKVIVENLLASMPADMKGDPKLRRTWIAEAINDVMGVWQGLRPDDAYVHTDAVELNRPVGAVDSSSLGAIGGLIEALERMLTRALKTMPLMMGITDGVSEANANRQWEIYAAGVKALQHLCESMLEGLFEIGLQAMGVAADVEFKFSELRAAEEMRDQQTRQMRNANIAMERDEGWISDDEASIESVGHEPTGEPKPAPDPVQTVPSSAAVVADPGSEKSALAQRGTRFVPAGSDAPLTPVPENVQVGLVEAVLAADSFDRAMGDEYAGLLDAAPKTEE